MWLAVLLQFAATGVLGLVALVVAGPVSGLSGLLGGLCAAIPSALFALRLTLHRGRPAESYPVVFFLGEFVKVGLTVGLFGAVIAWDGEKNWLALILGLIVALKMPLFAMGFSGRQADPVVISGGINSGGTAAEEIAPSGHQDIGQSAAGLKS